MSLDSFLPCIAMAHIFKWNNQAFRIDCSCSVTSENLIIGRKAIRANTHKIAFIQTSALILELLSLPYIVQLESARLWLD